jgi:hypothetical protein
VSGVRVALCLAAALVALPAAAKASSPTSAAIVASPDRPGARPVILTVKVRTLLQCGRIQATTIVIDLPARLHVPVTVPTAAVRIGRLHPRSITVRPRVLTIRQRIPSGPICASLTFGPAEIVFSRAAGIGNPAQPGRYVFRIGLGRQSLHAVLRVP